MTQTRLTEHSHGAGCACKLSPAELSTILGPVSGHRAVTHPDLLVGIETGDDAGVNDTTAYKYVMRYAATTTVAEDWTATDNSGAGLPAGIRRLAGEAPRVRLGLSIGSARPAVRRALMPIDRAHPLADALADPEVDVRASAAFAIGLIGHADGLVPLQGVMTDSSLAVRGRAVSVRSLVPGLQMAIGRLVSGVTLIATSVASNSRRPVPVRRSR